MSKQQQVVELIVKHLPPAGASLRLLDVGAAIGTALMPRRADLAIQPVPANGDWGIVADSVDAVVAYNQALDHALLTQALSALRVGGRFIFLNEALSVKQHYVGVLEDMGFTRILVEADTAGGLLRGEKPHTALRTAERIQHVAQVDQAQDLQVYRGRYVHLLIRQQPNKPVWALAPNEKITWQAAALESPEGPVFLAFSSLPKAVEFMQPAVMSGFIADVNKVGKFSRETAQDWRLRLNAPLEAVQDTALMWVEVDPNSAEVPDE